MFVFIFQPSLHISRLVFNFAQEIYEAKFERV